MDRPVTLAVAGDVMRGRLVNEAIAERGFAYPWGDLRLVLRQADLFLINLGRALANNHGGDFGPDLPPASPP